MLVTAAKTGDAPRTSTVVLLSVVSSGKAGEPLLALLQYIRESDLWRAQIAELSVDEAGDVTLWPQVGNYRIEFGKPDGVEMKFKKVKLFYTRIAPQKGWDRYHRVSVQFRNQLVCE